MNMQGEPLQEDEPGSPSGGPDPEGADNGTEGQPFRPYERTQRRLRVDGVTFGKAVKRHREAEHWSLRQLSKKSGVPLTTVANIERGHGAA